MVPFSGSGKQVSASSLRRNSDRRKAYSVADDTPSKADLLAFMERLERAQTAFVTVADRILGCLEIHNEKLDAILEAATEEPVGPSAAAKALQEIAASLNRQEGLLLAIPQSLAQAVRIELQREIADDLEADPDAFEEAKPGVGFGEDADHEPTH